MEIKDKVDFWYGFLMGIFATIIFSLVILFGDTLFGVESGRIEVGTIMLKINEMQSIIDRYYYDYLEYDKKSISSIEDSIYQGYINALEDPYSRYIPYNEESKVVDEIYGEYGGIGITIRSNNYDGSVVITDVFNGSPAYNAGIYKGDQIISVDGTDVIGEDATRIKMRGKPGTFIELGIKRNNEIINKKVQREVIKHISASNRLISNDIEYIKIDGWTESSSKELREILSNIKVNNIIIDLRDNLGGNVNDAINIAGYIMKDTDICYIEDKYGNTRKFTTSSNNILIADKNIVILVNNNTASASEIFVKAIKDNNKATIIGERTYGKGIVQSVIPMKDKSSLELTVGKWYSMDGENIHNIGVYPDIFVKQEGKEDIQLEKAIEFINNTYIKENKHG